jgi:hypothetical protein
VLSCETRDAAQTALGGKSRAPLTSLCNAHTAGENPDFPPLSSHVRSPDAPCDEQAIDHFQDPVNLPSVCPKLWHHLCSLAVSTSRYRRVQIIGIGVWAYQCRASLRSLRFTARVGPTQLFPPPSHRPAASNLCSMWSPTLFESQILKSKPPASAIRDTSVDPIRWPRQLWLVTPPHQPFLPSVGWES